MTRVPFRSDLAAAHARVESLEARLARSEAALSAEVAENERLRARQVVAAAEVTAPAREEPGLTVLGAALFFGGLLFAGAAFFLPMLFS